MILKNKNISFIVFILFTIIIGSCKKPIFDRRNKYVGDYEFTIHEKNEMSSFPVTIRVDTTFFYTGKITKIESNDKKERLIEVSYGASNKAIVNMEKDGNLTGGYGISGSYGSKENITIVYTWRAGGGNGSKEITGKKIK